MAPQTFSAVDLYGVGRDRQRLLASTENPFLAAWWQQFVSNLDAQLQEAAYAAIPGLEGMDAAAAYQARHSRLTAASSQMCQMAFAYALTRTSRYAARARDIAMHICADRTPWVDPRHHDIYPELNADLRHASTCIDMGVALGWLGNVLTAKESACIANTLADQAAIIYEDARRGAWWGDALNSNWTSHLMHGLGAAGLALSASLPGVTGPWIEMATDRMRRMLDLAAEEGAGIEGIGYYMGCYASILRYATELRNTTGQDLFEHAFWKKCALFPLYHTLPDLSGRTPLGDTHYPVLSGSVLLCGVAREARDGLAQWQAHRVLERASPDAISIYDLIYYDPSLPETPPDDLPTCRVFHSVQIASFRSGWDADAVYMHFHGGSNTWSHCHLDLNAFTLAAFGERLAIDHGSWGYSPHYFRVVEPQISTAWHNTVVVDGADQRQAPRYRMSYDPREGGDCYSLLQDHLSCEGIEMVRGDATSAYADMLDRCWREIVYLPPDRFVVYDNLLTDGARTQRHIQWLLHSEHPMLQEDSQIRVCGTKAELVIQPLFPTGWRCRFPDRLARGPASQENAIRETRCLSLYPEWVHIWNESPSNSPYPQWDARGGRRLYGPDYPFLVVLTPMRVGASIDWQVEAIQAPGIEGAILTRGEELDTVLFRRLGGPYALHGIESDADKVVVRERGGRIQSLALIRGTRLRYKGQLLIDEAEPISLALDL